MFKVKVAGFLVVFLMLSFFLLGPSFTMAQETEEERTGTSEAPPGWDKGEKEGWSSDVPPGIEKKGEMPRGLSEERKKMRHEKKKEHRMEMREKKREHKREIMEEKREHRQEMKQQKREHRGGSHRGK